MNNNNIDKYFITLKPLDKFFFGGERTLGQGNYTNYFVKSNHFPQQTGLLGLIRYELLAQKNMLATKGKKVPDAAKKLIGSHSFKLSKGEKDQFIENDFGAISKLSPLFIVKLDDSEKIEKRLTYNSLLHFKGDDFDGYKIVCDKESQRLQLFKRDVNGKIIGEVDDRAYKSKNGIFSGLVDEQGENYKYECVFQEDMQVGIDKRKEKNAFYKQQFFRLKPGYAFAFYVNMKKNSDVVFDSSLTMLGGEKSGFKMDVQKLSENEDWKMPKYDLSFEKCFENESTKNFSLFILKSHSYCKPSIYTLCKFVISNAVDFRFIETHIGKTQHYNNYDPKVRKPENLNKSSKYNLLKAGSIFLVENIDDKIDKFKEYMKNPCLEQIGYNHYTEIKN